MVKKKVAKKKSSTKSEHITAHEIKIERALIENFISLQKVMTNLSVKFDNLTQKLTKLLDLFEISAKALADKDFDFGGSRKEDKKILEKIDMLADQNKTIARGLTLLHEPREEEYEVPRPMMEQTMPMGPSSTLKKAQFPFKKRGDESTPETGGYQKSISAGFKEEFPQE